MRSRRLTTIFVLSLTVACGGTNGTGPGPIGAPAPLIYAIDTLGTLIVLRATRPDLITRTTAVTGLLAGDHIAGIDFRPQDGRLYALGWGSRIYRIDTLSGAATAVGTSPFTPALVGTAFGVSVDPISGLIRVVSDSGQNLRIDPTNGLALADTALDYATGDPHANSVPAPAGTAYTRGIPGATTTTLFAIDPSFDVLVTLPDPSSGQVTTVGPLGVNASPPLGFDIDGVSGVAYATITPPGVSAPRLYRVNLATGVASMIGTLGHSVPLAGIAIPP